MLSDQENKSLKRKIPPSAMGVFGQSSRQDTQNLMIALIRIQSPPLTICVQGSQKPLSWRTVKSKRGRRLMSRGVGAPVGPETDRACGCPSRSDRTFLGSGCYTPLAALPSGAVTCPFIVRFWFHDRTTPSARRGLAVDDARNPGLAHVPGKIISPHGTTWGGRIGYC